MDASSPILRRGSGTFYEVDYNALKASDSSYEDASVAAGYNTDASDCAPHAVSNCPLLTSMSQNEPLTASMHSSFRDTVDDGYRMNARGFRYRSVVADWERGHAKEKEKGSAEEMRSAAESALGAEHQYDSTTNNNVAARSKGHSTFTASRDGKIYTAVDTMPAANRTFPSTTSGDFDLSSLSSRQSAGLPPPLELQSLRSEYEQERVEAQRRRRQSRAFECPKGTYEDINRTTTMVGHAQARASKRPKKRAAKGSGKRSAPY